MKVLIIRFSSIGDIILTSPVARCLKQQLPDAEVHILTKARFIDLVQYSPHVDKVHAVTTDLRDVIPALRSEAFHHIIDLHNNLRSMRVKRALGVPSHSFNKLNVPKWLLVNLKVDRLPRKHIVERYLEPAARLGIRNDGKGLELFIPKDRHVSINSLPTIHQPGYVAMAIGAAHATKRLPVHKLIQLAEAIAGPIVIIGGEQDRATAAEICNAVGGNVYDATGKYDLLGSASLIKQATHVITHDSGAMHMAAAFNRPLLSVWGNTVPEFGMYPYMPERPDLYHIAQVADLACRPCSKIGFDQCPRGHFHCMEQQDMRTLALQVKK